MGSKVRKYKIAGLYRHRRLGMVGSGGEVCVRS